LSKATGASIDELKLIFSFILSYPLAAVVKRLPDSKPWQKNVFIISVTIFYLLGLFSLWDGLRTILYDAVAAYAIAYYIDGSLMPWIAFVVLMGHMSVSHIARELLADPSVVDITGAQMVLVMKLTAFCWNVHDGRLKPELATDAQKERAIYTMPSFLDYAGYVFYFPSFMIGPAFDYVDYRRYLDTTMFDATPSGPAAPPNKKGRRIPRSGTPALIKALTGAVWLVLYLQLGPKYNPETVLSDKYMNYHLPRRVWQLYMLGIVSRTKYYGVWTLTEGACILSGLGYNGVDPTTKKVKWDKLENVNPWTIESAQNSRAYLEGWNKNTNNWLRNYVYLRVTPRGKKPGFRASLATFVTSALWHGFSPGYYLTFVLAAFIQTVAKNFRRYLRPFFLTPDGKSPTSNKKYYDAVCWVVTQFAFCFTTAPFVLLSFSGSLRVWARVYFYCVVGVAASLAFFASPGKKMLIKRLDMRNHPHVRKTISQETVHLPSLGLPNDPGREIDEAIDEIKMEIDQRQRRGSKVTMPTGEDLRRLVEQKVGIQVKQASDGRVVDARATVGNTKDQAESKKEL
jgi:lysophospholipid acyltransferase